MDMELLHGYGGAGNSGLSKIYKGLTTPTSPKEYDMWIKSDIVNPLKYVFDKDFSTAKTYDEGSLVFYITSNPLDQGYRILTQLFNRSKIFDMKVPLYCSAFYSGGVWTYPLVYIYVNGAWTYLSGALLDSDSRIMVYELNSSKVIVFNRYLLDGTSDITDKVSTVNSTNTTIYCSATRPLDGTKYVWLRIDTSNWKIIVMDKDGNVITSIPVTTSNTTPTMHKILIDDTHIYALEHNGTTVVTITKIDITTNTVVLYNGNVAVNQGYMNAQGLIATQDANYIYTSIYKISKSTLTKVATSTLAPSNGCLGTTLDKSGRVIVTYCMAGTPNTINIAICNTSDLSVIKTVTFNLSTLITSGTSQGITIDKDDNLITWMNETAVITNHHITKYLKGTLNDSWTLLTEVIFSFTLNSLNNRTFLTDVYGNLYGNFANGAGTGFAKLNPNLQTVYLKPTIGNLATTMSTPFTVDPCEITADYLRNYFK